MSLIVPSRRRFLFGVAALIAAPSVVRAASLMPVSAMRPRYWGDGIHDDAPYLNWLCEQARLRGDAVIKLPSARFHIQSPIRVEDGEHLKGGSTAHSPLNTTIYMDGGLLFSRQPDSQITLSNFNISNAGPAGLHIGRHGVSLP